MLCAHQLPEQFCKTLGLYLKQEGREESPWREDYA